VPGQSVELSGSPLPLVPAIVTRGTQPRPAAGATTQNLLSEPQRTACPLAVTVQGPAGRGNSCPQQPRGTEAHWERWRRLWEVTVTIRASGTKLSPSRKLRAWPGGGRTAALRAKPPVRRASPRRRTEDVKEPVPHACNPSHSGGSRFKASLCKTPSGKYPTQNRSGADPGDRKMDIVPRRLHKRRGGSRQTTWTAQGWLREAIVT
jgi:hypothetical protein